MARKPMTRCHLRSDWIFLWCWAWFTIARSESIAPDQRVANVTSG